MNLAIGCFFKDETRRLAEWLIYHQMVGVEHFFLFCNDSDPRATEAVLTSFNAQITVEYRPGGVAVQQQILAYNWVLQHAQDCRWVAFIDLDEFLFPLYEDSIPAILKDYERYDGLVVQNCEFGSSTLYYPPLLQTESFIYRAEDHSDHARFFKAIVNPSRAIENLNPHAFLMQPGSLVVDENNRTVVEGACVNLNSDYRPRRLRVNHYRLRSWLEFKEKVKRWQDGGHPHFSRGAIHYWQMVDRCPVRDASMARFVPRIKDTLQQRPFH